MTDLDRTHRDRADRCPGVLRPWIADDGALVRIRLIGGRLSTASLARLMAVAADHGDGDLHLTSRANVQVRAVAHADGCVRPEFVEAVEATGLLPSRTHELVRNVMVSPLSGRSGGQADLRPAAHRYDELLRDDPDLAALSARFLVVLDDGRGDLANRPLDLGAMAVDADHAQLRVGTGGGALRGSQARTSGTGGPWAAKSTGGWGEVVPLDAIPDALIAFAHRFVAAASTDHPWHVDDLADGGASILGAPHARDLRTHVTALPLPHGTIAQDDGRSAEHVPVPDGRLTPALAEQVLARAGDEIVVTPWRSLLLPDLETA